MKEERLRCWQDWLSRHDGANGAQVLRMDHREALYRGDRLPMEPLTPGERRHAAARRPAHLRNIISENIESMISATIPRPRVSARRPEDEWRARLLEELLRSELDRLPMEELNDRMERTIPIQGGAYWLVEWDDSRRWGGAVGEVTVQALHPRQVVPQEGICTAVEDMDAIAIKVPQTRESIRRRFGVEVEAVGEAEPEARGSGSPAEELVTRYVVYYRNREGGIGRFSWCGDRVLEDLEDFQKRQTRCCRDCGAAVPAGEQCPGCGGRRFAARQRDYEEVWTEKRTRSGTVIPGAHVETDENGLPRWAPTRIPYYRPDCYPLFLQRNITLFGQLLGDSDVDKIADQQNTLNRMEQKIIDRLVKAGTRITLPDRADFRVDPEDGEKWYIGSAADKNLIGVYDFSGDLHYEMSYLNQVYEEARQLLGITDSYQGRVDRSAVSGVAKQFAAAQSAGRLESKRVLKEAAYGELFRRIVQLHLAYADEPRPVRCEGSGYRIFDRYDFLEQDEQGEWHWILDRFQFSCDTAAPAAGDRQQLWERADAHLRAGAFGDPRDPAALRLYWTRLERLHYPGAGEIRSALEQALQAQGGQQPTIQETEGEDRT